VSGFSQHGPMSDARPTRPLRVAPAPAVVAGPDRHPRGSPRDARLRLRGPQVLSDAELLGVGAGLPSEMAEAVLARLGRGGQARPGAGELEAAGLRPAVAVRLAALLELAHRWAAALPDGAWRIRSPADVAGRLLGAMGALEREELWVALLNTKNVVTGLSTVYAGSVAGCTVRVGEVFRDAVRAGSAAVVVVHNHPSGDPSPSPEDLRITAELASAGRLLDIVLLDHLVIGRGTWTSLRALGVLPG
jgi:DNA repair protein RadC